MTREEAIFYIKELQKTYALMDKKVAEAVDVAIEALSADAVSREEHEELYRKAKEVNGMANDILADFPSYKEILSVVRCKDCKYYHKSEKYSYCNKINVKGKSPKQIDFCSYGERKGGGE